MFALPASASAEDAGSGGGAFASTPEASELVCDDGRVSVCGRRQWLTIRGEGLSTAKTVAFLGRKGRRDDRRATVISKSANSVVVRVPSIARSGPVQVFATSGRSNAPKVKITKASMTSKALGDELFIDAQKSARFDFEAAPGGSVELVRLGDLSIVRAWPIAADATGQQSVTWNGQTGGKDAQVGRYGFRIVPSGGAPGPLVKQFSLLDHIFPIRGRHNLGAGQATNFGGGRGHQGQDMFAKCGTPLVAARGGEVIMSAYQARAGNYLVIRRADGQSYAYMHLRERSPLRKGDRVLTGQAIGQVGDTGRADGCHLHFELWTAPGWYAGGKPINPLPLLELWDSWS